MRAALELDKVPLTRREIVYTALLVACFAFEPSFAKTVGALAFGAAGAALAAIAR